jgi:hypothetical protein
MSTAAPPQVPLKPDYQAMTPEQQADMRILFRSKFNILRSSYPSWNIQDPPEFATLDQIHMMHEDYVKHIMLSLNSGQWKVCMIVLFLGIETFGIKVLGLDFRGYTESQLSTIDRYNRLLIELGEKYYTQGGSAVSVETRFVLMAGLSALTFIAVKYLCKWLGGDAMRGTVQNTINSILNSCGVSQDGKSSNGVTHDEHGISSVPAPAPTGDFDLGSMIGGLMGNGGGNGGLDLGGLIGKFGSMMTANMTPRDEIASVATKEPQLPSKRRVLFTA